LPGVSGPLLLDSVPNLAVVSDWIDGQVLWTEVVFGNASGPFGRPISMATFLVNAAISGDSPTAYKLTNLAIHIVCGGLIIGCLARMLRRDPLFARNAAFIASVIAVWWVLLPLQASTVLYSIQRMAQLATLFMLCGLWLFVYARDQIEQGNPSGPWLLWLGVPLFTVLAALSKENGLLLPLLCLAIEIGYFSRLSNDTSSVTSRKSVWAFFVVAIAVPAAVGTAYLALHPEFLSVGYVNRDFTLPERLLTQSRALWTYVQALLIPVGPGLTLMHDSYPISRGLFDPITTALALAAWPLSLGVAIYFRRTVPALFTGLLIFLFGHAMESSFIALEPIFMHRNYLPGIGILLAVTGVTVALYRALPRTSAIFRHAVPVLLIVALVTLWGTSLARSWTWQSHEQLTAVELRHHPDSLRTRMNAASLALANGRPSAAFHQAEMMETIVRPLQVPTVLSWKVAIYCAAGIPVPGPLLDRIRQHQPQKLHHFMLEPLSQTVTWLRNDECGNFKPGVVAEAYSSWLNSLRQPRNNERVWKFRFYIGNLFAAAENYTTGLDLTYNAWRDSGKQFWPGVLAFQLATRLERFELAEEILIGLEQGADSDDLRQIEQVRAFRTFLEDPESYPNGTVPRATYRDIATDKG